MATLYTARLLYSGDAPPLEGGALLDLDGQIAAIGSLKQLKRQYPAVAVVDYGDALLLPLLVNAHTHLELTDYPLWAEKLGETAVPADFVDWILQLIRVKRTLSRKHYNISVANGIAQSIAAGSGAVGDVMSQHFSRKAYLGSPLLGTLYLESLGQDPTAICRLKNELNAILAEKHAGQLQLGLSPHAPYSISADYLKDIYHKCQSEALACTTHLAESAAEVEFIQASTGPFATKLYPRIGWQYLVPDPSGYSPTEYLQEKDGLFASNSLVHGVQLTASDIDLLAENRCSLVLCPRSNSRLAVGKAPVAKLLKAGVRLALGTDSLASNDSLSVWDEIAFAHRWFAGQVDAPCLFRMATLGGAEMLGLQQQLGTLATGKQCSFQVLTPDTLPAAGDTLDYCVAAGRTEDIAQVVIQGQVMLSGLH